MEILHGDSDGAYAVSTPSLCSIFNRWMTLNLWKTLTLHVYFLAYIATGDGRSIRTMFTRRSYLLRDAVIKSNLCWPVEKPTAKYFGIWLTYLNVITQSDFRVHHKLVIWIFPSHITPTWLYDKSLKQLLRSHGPNKW